MTLKDTTQSLDDEHVRVMSNPEHLIMSEALEGVVDFAAADDPDIWGSSTFTCHFNFGGKVVAGALKGFRIQSNYRAITIVSSDDAAIQLLGMPQLTGYVCKSIYDEIVDSMEVNGPVEILVNFDDEQQIAEVTITIPQESDK